LPILIKNLMCHANSKGATSAGSSHALVNAM
jgi:hypothetical protein